MWTGVLGTASLQLATPTLGLCLATLGLLHTGGPSRACQFQPSQPADLLDLVGQLWGATAAQRMPKAEAGGLFRLGARLGARNFPERTVPFAHSQGAKTIGFPWKIPSRARNPWAVAAPPGPRPGPARRRQVHQPAWRRTLRTLLAGDRADYTEPAQGRPQSRWEVAWGRARGLAGTAGRGKVNGRLREHAGSDRPPLERCQGWWPRAQGRNRG